MVNVKIDVSGMRTSFFQVVISISSAALIACLPEKNVDKCTELSSCASCLTKTYCTWCVTKSHCTKQACGHDNVIYPKPIVALMSGPDFCPRVVDTKEKLILKSGKRHRITVKITQIYLYMAFTLWKCKFNINGKEHIVPAVLLTDNVFCESLEFKNESDEPYVTGSVSVLWDYSKEFDGSLSFQICRCDLDAHCIACER